MCYLNVFFFTCVGALAVAVSEWSRTSTLVQSQSRASDLSTLWPVWPRFKVVWLHQDGLRGLSLGDGHVGAVVNTADNGGHWSGDLTNQKTVLVCINQSEDSIICVNRSEASIDSPDPPWQWELPPPGQEERRGHPAWLCSRSHNYQNLASETVCKLGSLWPRWPGTWAAATSCCTPGESPAAAIRISDPET